MDPRPFTLRRLVDMARGRQRDEWDRTSTVLAMLANLHRDPKKRRTPYRPADFHPMETQRRRGLRLGKSTMGVLKKIMCPRN